MSNEQSSSRIAGAALILASALSVVLIMYHPRVHAHRLSDLVESFAEVQTVNGLVHGSFVALLGVMVFGFSYLCSQLGWSSPSVRAGIIAYVMGSLAMMTATMIDGFIIGDFVADNAQTAPEQLKPLMQTMSLARSAIQMASKMGVLAISVAIILWSLVLLQRNDIVHWTGLFGAVSGVILITLLLLGYLPMNVHGMLAFITTQAIWTITVGVLMWRQRIKEDMNLVTKLGIEG